MRQEYVAGMEANQANSQLPGEDLDYGAQLARHQDRSFDNTAKHLAQRAQAQPTDVGGADNTDLELELLNVQQRLHRDHGMNPLERMQLEAKAQTLASQLVGAEQQTQQSFNDDQWDDRQRQQEEHLKNEGAEDYLKHAGEHLDAETVEGWNQVLDEGDELATATTHNLLKGYRDNPEAFVTKEQGYTPISEDVTGELASLYGQETAEIISTCSQVIAQGLKTPQQVMRTIGKDPSIFMAIADAARRGLITIAL